MSTTPGGRGRAAIQRIRQGELASAVSAVVLLVAMFALQWYGLNQAPGKANGAERAHTENAWHGLTLLRWLMLVTIVVAIGALVLHLTQREHGSVTDTTGAVTGLGALTALLLSYRVLVDLPSPSSVVDQKLGSIVGLLSAYGIALGGYHSLRASRARARGLARAAAAEVAASPPPAG